MIAGALGVGLVALPLSTAKAQYDPACSPFPLEWPFCAVGAVLGTAAMIITAPIRALTVPPALYYSGYYGQPYYPPEHCAPPYNYGPH
jgi:hypothetical protein